MKVNFKNKNKNKTFYFLWIFFKLVFCLIFSENELLNQTIKNNCFNFNHYVIDFNLFIDQETVFKDSKNVRYETTIHYMYTIF